VTDAEGRTPNAERRTANDEPRTTNDERPRVIVVAAVVEIDGRLLITRRQEGVHLEGFWEFPGGKCDKDEPLRVGLARELLEELDVPSRVGDEIFATVLAYPERTIELHFFRCELLGEPRPQLGQEMRWVRRDELAGIEFPPADAELIQMLTQPLG
jgi:8-oxo-dGTP diphosphatase